MPSKMHKNNAVKGVSLEVRAGEIVCIAGIEGNGQTEFVYGLTGLEKDHRRQPGAGRARHQLCHHPRALKARHEPHPGGPAQHGLVLDYTLADNMVLQRYWQPEFQSRGIHQKGEVVQYAQKLIEQYDVRSGQGPATVARSMSGGNQQKAIVAREIDKDPELLVAVQPTRSLDVGAIEYIHKQLVAERDRAGGAAGEPGAGRGDEPFRTGSCVMCEGEIVGELDPKETTVQELGLYMAGAKRNTRGLLQMNKLKKRFRAKPSTAFWPA